MYLGDCKKCGCSVWWDNENSCCVFECEYNDCTCECPYPPEFMEEWRSNSSDGAGIETLYYFWKRGAAWQAELMLNQLDALYAERKEATDE